MKIELIFEVIFDIKALCFPELHIQVINCN